MSIIDKFEVTDILKIHQYKSLIADEDKNQIEHFDWKASKEDQFYVEAKAILYD